jgi:hypothetical protein
MKEEKIICAAIWYNNGKVYPNQPLNIKEGIVVCGWRHGNCISILNAIFPDKEYVLKNKDGKHTIQGFLTSNGTFVNRVEASEIAFEAMQTEEDSGCLFSEDLY